jgi:ABC-type molybdate transport system substrate-binding protein
VPLALLAPVAVKAALQDLVALHEQARAVQIATSYVLNPEVARRIMAGEAYDIAITNPHYVPDLIAAGRASADSHRPFGRVPLALVAQAGGPHTDLVATEAEIADMLRAAPSVAYTGEGTSGRIFLDMARRLGVLDGIAPRLHPLGAGEPVRAVATGSIAFAAAPLTTALATPGVVPVAICPSSLGADIDMSVFLNPDVADDDTVQAVLQHLTDPGLDGFLSVRGVRRFAFDALA